MRASASRSVTALVLALGFAGAGAGCGRSAQSSSAGSPGADRDGVPSSRGARQQLRAEQAALHRQVLASLHQASASKRRYGGLPADLAGRQGGLERPLVATPRSPARTAQGAPVLLRLPGGSAVATAVGPMIGRGVPGTGTPQTRASFTITLTDVHGSVPLRQGNLAVIDASGQLRIPGLAITRRRGADTARASLVLPVGDGRLIYAPLGRPLVSWDFTLETD